MARAPHEETGAGFGGERVAGAAPGQQGSWKRPHLVKIGDVSLFVDVVGHGYPLVLMHGGPSADHFSLLPFRRLADRFTLVFYDHRCNGRSVGLRSRL